MKNHFIIKNSEGFQAYEGGDDTEKKEKKGFEWIPKEAGVLDNAYAIKVRTHLQLCVGMHCLAFVLEVLMYDWVISMMFTECFLAWLAFFASMKMSETIIWVYMVLLGLSGVLGVFSLFSVGGWFLIYIGQLAAYGFALQFLFIKM